MKKRLLLINILYLFVIAGFTQNKTLDSLKLVLKTAKHDTTRCNILNAIVEAESDDAIWPTYNEQLYKLAEKNINSNSSFKNIYLKHLAAAINNMGFLANNLGDYEKALTYYDKSQKIQSEIGDKIGIASSFNNIGLIYRNRGDIEKALEYYGKSLNIRESIGDKNGVAISLINIGYVYNKQGDTKKALEYSTKSLKLWEEIGDKSGIANSLNHIGNIYQNKGDNKIALEFLTKSLKIRQEIGDKSAIAISLNNIGTVYDNQGDIKKTLEYYTKSLKIWEGIGDKSAIAISLNNIALVYERQGETKKALEYSIKSLKIHTDIGNKGEVARLLNNIGYIYNNQGDIKKALDYYTKSQAIREDIGDKSGVANSLNNIGNIFENQGDIKKALDYYTKSLKIFEDIEDKSGIVVCLNNIGNIYQNQGNIKKALEYLDKSLAMAKELGFPSRIQDVAQSLYKLHKTIGNSEKALVYYEEYITMRDSITNQENKKASIKNQLKYEYEKKAAADSVKIAEEKKVVTVQLKQEKTQRIALYGGLALVLVFAGFMFNRFRVTQKQKNIIELKEKETQQQNEIITIQKHLVEEKHKEITDSINYAERIQRSFLATKELLETNLKEYFILFKPKDVVSGDFYWAASLKTTVANGNKNLFALAIADSTGHGVPGAIMSLLNVTSLEKAVEHHTNPSEILNHTRQTIIERLKKDGSADGGKDGMDCSLLMFDFTKNELQIAAANNPVWIIRDNKMIEIKPDKMPVGKSERQYDPFTLHTVELQTGDTIYALTDGFPDQFGGPKGKKFMSKNLKEVLIANVHLPIHQQKGILETTFKNWVGGLEQVDDVCIIGIRV